MENRILKRIKGKDESGYGVLCWAGKRSSIDTDK
jgi:hypothetical protein